MKLLFLIPLLPIILSWSGFGAKQYKQHRQLNSTENNPNSYNENMNYTTSTPSDIEANEKKYYNAMPSDLNTKPTELERIE